MRSDVTFKQERVCACG